MLTCSACGQENPPIARFCLACGAPLAARQPAIEEERKVITALFTDIVGSTAAAERMDPEDVRARLAPYYARVRAELEQYGGSVEKFIGDAVVALFGAPVAHEDDPERAIRAALAIRRAIHELNAEDEWLDLHIRTAVHTGEALVVIGPNVTEGLGMAAGDVMNTAARLQSAAPVDGIVVGQATHRAAADHFEFRAVEPISAKGKAEPIPAWELVGEKAPPDRRAARTRLVGRAEELDLLNRVWAKTVAAKRQRLATVLGAPGIGKSRLLQALAERVESVGAVHWGGCLPYGEGITYWPITEILNSAAGIRHDDDAAGAAAKLESLVRSLGAVPADEQRTIEAALGNLFSLSKSGRQAVGVGDVHSLTGEPRRGSDRGEEISQSELHWGVRRLLELLARQRPILLVLEDLHWAEQTLLELLASILDSETDAPILVLATARSELKDTWPEVAATDEARTLIELAPLTEGESRALLAELVGRDDSAAGRLESLVGRAGGNPLFLEETVQMLAEAELEPGVSTESLPVPENLQALIGSRLDALLPADKRVAEQASVAGTVFWEGAVAHLNGLHADLSSSLATLAHRDFVRAHAESAITGDREWEFKHVLVRDVAYDRLPKGRRAELHVRFAEWIVGIPGPEDEFIEIQAYHLEQACRLAAAIARSPIEPPILDATRVLARAAEKAQRHEGWREAGRYYERALEVLGEAHPERAVELQVPRSLARVVLGELRKAREELEAIVERAALMGRDDLRGAALVILGNLDHRQGRPNSARRRAGEVQAVAARTGDRSLGVRAGYSVAAVQADYEGNPEAAVADLRAALAVAEEIDDRALRIEGHLRLGFLLFNMGDLAGAEEELHRCTELAGTLGGLRDEARATFLLGLAKYYRGELAEAESLNLRARDWLERTGESFFQVQNFRALGLYALARDDAIAAERWLREAIPVALEEGGRTVLEVYRYLAEALARQQRTDEADEILDLARRTLPEEDVTGRAYVVLGQAAVEAARRERAAIDTYEAGIELLKQQRLPLEASEARIVYAEALRAFGEADAADEQLRVARETLDRLGATGLVARIEAALQQKNGAGTADPAPVG